MVEVLSKSLIWLTAPMQSSPKKRSILANADWLRATAEGWALPTPVLYDITIKNDNRKPSGTHQRVTDGLFVWDIIQNE